MLRFLTPVALLIMIWILLFLILYTSGFRWTNSYGQVICSSVWCCYGVFIGPLYTALDKNINGKENN